MQHKVLPFLISRQTPKTEQGKDSTRQPDQKRRMSIGFGTKAFHFSFWGSTKKRNLAKSMTSPMHISAPKLTVETPSTSRHFDGENRDPFAKTISSDTVSSTTTSISSSDSFFVMTSSTSTKNEQTMTPHPASHNIPRPPQLAKLDQSLPLFTKRVAAVVQGKRDQSEIAKLYESVKRIQADNTKSDRNT
eukprot:c20312_g1_i1.p1 GENE.c20312_g1_i1~~c20312_g1_i1.p1  ORF type:complete len:190 (+),score=22.99 c20312_g1_i1:130-699(+)